MVFFKKNKILVLIVVVIIIVFVIAGFLLWKSFRPKAQPPEEDSLTQFWGKAEKLNVAAITNPDIKQRISESLNNPDRDIQFNGLITMFDQTVGQYYAAHDPGTLALAKEIRSYIRTDYAAEVEKYFGKDADSFFSIQEPPERIRIPGELGRKKL